jgi:hypoxanthine phosphoribosyltransferase
VSVAAEKLLTPSPGEIAFGADLIAGRLDELARQISGDYRGRDLVLVTVLKGSAMFLADLSRRLTIPHRLDFIAISAYRGASAGSSGRIRLLKDIDRPVRDAHVLIVEDIVDTGLTLNYLFTTLRFRGAESVEVCTLLDRPYRRLIEIAPRYVGFTAPDAFVVGYGFDYRQRFRNLPDIHLLAR